MTRERTSYCSRRQLRLGRLQVNDWPRAVSGQLAAAENARFKKEGSLAATAEGEARCFVFILHQRAQITKGSRTSVAVANLEGPRDPPLAVLWRGDRDSGAGVQRLQARVRHRLAGASRSSYPSGGSCNLVCSASHPNHHLTPAW